MKLYVTAVLTVPASTASKLVYFRVSDTFWPLVTYVAGDWSSWVIVNLLLVPQLLTAAWERVEKATRIRKFILVTYTTWPAVSFFSGGVRPHA
jgi:hypothetical protein